METSDYFKIQNSEISTTLIELKSTITSMKDSGRVEESFDKVNMALKEIINADIEQITSEPIENFILHLTSNKKISTYNLDLLADLLFITGHLVEMQNNKELTKRIYSRSLSIYQYLLKAETDFPYERHLRIKELKEILLQ